MFISLHFLPHVYRRRHSLKQLPTETPSTIQMQEQVNQLNMSANNQATNMSSTDMDIADSDIPRISPTRSMTTLSPNHGRVQRNVSNPELCSAGMRGLAGTGATAGVAASGPPPSPPPSFFGFDNNNVHNDCMGRGGAGGQSVFAPGGVHSNARAQIVNAFHLQQSGSVQQSSIGAVGSLQQVDPSSIALMDDDDLDW